MVISLIIPIISIIFVLELAKITFVSSSSSSMSTSSSSSSSSVRPLIRLFSRLFDGERLSEVAEVRIGQLESKLAQNEQQLIDYLDMDTTERRKKRIEVTILRKRLELENVVVTYNNLLGKDDESSSALKQKLSAELRRLNSQLFIYNRVRMHMDINGQLELNSHVWSLDDPLYANVFVHFLVEGAHFCASVKVGEKMRICPDLEQYNMLEELIKQILTTSTPEKVVEQIHFEFVDKKEQMNNFNALFHPNGILESIREESTAIRGTENDGKAIGGKIEKSGEKRHKKYLKRKIIWEKMYKLRNSRNMQNAQFQLKLVYAKALPPRREGKPKLLAVKIKKC